MAMQNNMMQRRQWDGFVAVSTKVLRGNTTTGFNIYAPGESNEAPERLHPSGEPLTSGHIRSFLQKEGCTILIREEERGEYRRYIEANMGAILLDGSLSLVERAGYLYDGLQFAMREILKLSDPETAYLRATAMARHSIAFQRSDAAAFGMMLQRTSDSYYVYSHSANVLVLVTALALTQPFSEDEHLEIATGALLHDIGKNMIDPIVLNFPGKLSAGQWEEMKRHPLLAQDFLSGYPECGAIVMDIVRHHHEKLDGSGYPDGLREADISPWVRICTIADIFDALTTKRVYAGANKSFTALKTMHEEMNQQIDRHFFASFIKIMGDQLRPQTRGLAS